MPFVDLSPDNGITYATHKLICEPVFQAVNTMDVLQAGASGKEPDCYVQAKAYVRSIMAYRATVKGKVSAGLQGGTATAAAPKKLPKMKKSKVRVEFLSSCSSTFSNETIFPLEIRRRHYP